MKKLPAAIAHAAGVLLLPVFLFAQAADSLATPASPAPKLAPADRAWLDVRAAMFTPDFSKQLPADPVARKAALLQHAAVFIAAADRAKDFYSKYPDHAKASEARRQEIQALLGAVHAGDATVEGRLNSTVQAMRDDSTVANVIKASTVSVVAFDHAMRGKKSKTERFAAIEEVARSLTAEFPDQPQGYESLMTVAAVSDDEANSRKIAQELLNGSAPDSVKANARALVGRLDLVGKRLAPELDGADAKITKAALKSGQTTLIYTWASWSPGSLDLAAKLKKRGVNANVLALNLDEDIKAADALATKNALLGIAIYDDRGREGALAQRLKVKSAAQVIIVDAEGVIRDVRGEVDLEKKLAQLGL